MWNRNPLFAITLFAVFAVLASLFLDRRVDEIEVPQNAFLVEADQCSQTLSASLDLPDVPTSLFNNGMVRFLPCSDGLLLARMRGSEAGGYGAHVLVSQKGENIWEGSVTNPRVVEARIQAGFWVTIAFVNDSSHEGSDRNLWIDELSFAPL